MRALALAVCIAAVTAPAALAKGRLVVGLSDTSPRAGRPVTVTVRTEWIVPSNDWLRLVAVAPGRDWYDVVGTVTGDSAKAHAAIPRDGFGVKLRRVAPRTWRAVVRLPTAGRWRLVVPNGTHVGFMVPPPAAWMPWVVVRAP
jgi:hypothetical protein